MELPLMELSTGSMSVPTVAAGPIFLPKLAMAFVWMEVIRCILKITLPTGYPVLRPISWRVRRWILIPALIFFKVTWTSKRRVVGLLWRLFRQLNHQPFLRADC